ncbi:MAG: mechanosensitive ion channel family protein [Alphaproteobacteria bacterium]|nr:mechanosensitive ion channel family protein [Alphaproteobacteria bacterium]MBU0793334.1 mechanosensitive ion channel family protein [Alphaproteobacteria bacterium]MBU0876853.1 mechanosensitive ion channel family protein [Alphaproteobacteria bacterium]MBU1770420.1 mechanosensitive ion channel family protein [Alphaproteobacteria bacterium]
MLLERWALPPLIEALILVVVAVLAALAVHWIGVRIVRRLLAASDSHGAQAALIRARRPSRWLLVAVVLAFVRPSLDLGERGHLIWSQVAAMVVPGLLGWLAVALIHAMQDVIEQRADISVADNLRARRKRTRTAILSRIAIVLSIFITLCLMLFSIPSVRAVGVTLMASAGLAALAVGAAAQPLLKNVIAGIQLAFTEPIRIDDVLIIEGEWGRVEEIHMTYVVVAIWDERRLVVPISRFLESSFQNWTRSTSQLLGSVFFHLDPTADIARLRARYEEIVKTSPLWDGRAQVLQVTETSPDAIEVRGLATARNAGEAFDLRCEIREKMLAVIRDEMPEALPRRRGLLAQDDTGPQGPESRGSA